MSTALPDRSLNHWRTVGSLFLGIFLAALSLLALLLLGRRLSGALVAPLEFVPALTAGLLISAGAWGLRRWAVAVNATELERRRSLAVVTLITWLLVVGITLSSMNPLAILALWLPLIAAEASWRVLPPEPMGSSSAHRLQPASPLPTDASVVQQFTRVLRDDREVIGGVAQITFAPGEQTAALHLAFSPPLESDPQVQVEAVDAKGVTLRATECRSYGVRLEARRSRDDTADPLTLLVQFEASSAAN